jgi:hypothetical protein
MSIRSVARLVFVLLLMAPTAALGFAVDSPTPLPSRSPVLTVNLKTNEVYYLDEYKADIDRLESGLSGISGQKVSLAAKDKLGILLDTVDWMLFRQYCESENIRVTDTEVTNQLAQYKTSLGPGTTDAMVEATLRRSGVFTDLNTNIRQSLLFNAYLRAKKTDEVKAIGAPSYMEVLNGYDDMKFNLRRPDSYRFSMLLARTQGKSDSEKKKASDTMHAIAAQLKADPASFDQYFVRGALDPVAADFETRPGLIIARTPESKKQYPALYDAIFDLKEGEVSDVVEEDVGYCIVRIGQYLAEKQLDLDDPIEGLTNTRAATVNPSALVMQLVVSELQNQKLAALQKSARDEINAKLRKDGNIIVSLTALSGLLAQPEIDRLKSLKDSGYSIDVQ